MKNKHIIAPRVLFVSFIAIMAIACKDGNVNKKSIQDSTIEKGKSEKIQEWEVWLQQNKTYNIKLYGVSAQHSWAINSLCNMFYSGDEKIKGDVDMIQWVLDRFYPIQTTDDEKQLYEKLEKQVSFLLNFEVDSYQGYEVRRKSAISRLLHEFKIKVYEDKIRSKIQDKEVNRLFEVEKEAWEKYMISTSDAFEKNVLGKDSYSLKNVFWNYYDFDIMEQRYRSLVCMYLHDYSVWDIENVCEWGKVECKYDFLSKQIKQQHRTSRFHYSYREKIDALNADEETFKTYLDAHYALSSKLDINNKGYLLHGKYKILERFLGHYNTPQQVRF